LNNNTILHAFSTFVSGLSFSSCDSVFATSFYVAADLFSSSEISWDLFSAACLSVSEAFYSSNTLILPSLNAIYPKNIFSLSFR